ncbi:MAG TPA: transglutaminase family protein [Caulobacteraceae bacterium]|nr:transglutaminase family protein [Caulobacteraceae bacterium]
MIYWVRHRTTYTYEAQVTYARCVMRLTPPSSAAQTVLENLIAIAPEPSHALRRIGPFGEETLTVLIDRPHKTLVIEANSRVDVHAQPVPPAADSPAWETVRGAAFETSGLDSDSPASFLYPTRRTPITREMTDFARESFPAGRPIFEAAVDLMTRIHDGFVYDGEATTVSTAAAEAFAERRGVCQDFAHIMISGLRGLGLPTAYVSGYLRTNPPPGRPRLQGSDATHAWVCLWCGEHYGWIGFDPTNAILARNDHITLAVGRDYADVAPIDGLTLAPGEQALKVEVDVVPEDEIRGGRLGDPKTASRPARRPITA